VECKSGEIYEKTPFPRSQMLLVAGSALWISTRQASSGAVLGGPSSETDAAYRDGLFQGKQGTERNASYHAPVGRWSAKTDRAAFTNAFEEAYRSRTLNELAEEEFH
jgi:hypothetical protein